MRVFSGISLCLRNMPSVHKSSWNLLYSPLLSRLYWGKSLEGSRSYVCRFSIDLPHTWLALPWSMCLQLFYPNKSKTRFQFYNSLLKTLYNDWKVKVHWHHNFSIVSQEMFWKDPHFPNASI